MSNRSLALCHLLLATVALSARADDFADWQPALLRRPVAALLSENHDTLYVVNQRSGGLSIIDLNNLDVINELLLGRHLSDLILLPGTNWLLIADEATHQLLVTDVASGTVREKQRLDVIRSPIDLAVSPDGRTVSVAGLWSRRIMLLSMDTATPQDLDIRVTATIRLPFAPRLQQFLDGGRRLVVADAFGGRIALINCETHQIESIRELPAQNIRGLVVSDDEQQLLLTHQILSPLAQADFDDIHWGNLLRNVIREIDLKAVLDPAADLVTASRVVALGDLGNGAADPAGITLLPELNGWMTCLSGVNDVSVGTRLGGGRISVGTRPTSAVWDPKRQLAYVLCTLDDAVAVLDPVAQTVVKRVSLGPQPPLLPSDRGEKLFYDGRRSHDGWISCHSCHPDGHTTSGLADTKSDDSYGTPKRILSLLGTRDNNPWAWNGQFRELHEQVGSSFATTLNGDPLSAPEISDVVAYLHTLTPPPPVNDGEQTEDELKLVQTGRQLFAGLGCVECHVPPQTFTVDRTFDVGLSDEAGLQKFNPPSLRGLSQRERFFHDGRVDSLEAVFTEAGHQLDESLPEAELALLLAYLRSL